MEKNIEISMLCQIYGNLLTKKQLNILECRYNQDLSLSEIAENEGITRQAVRDNIMKGEKKLFEFEKKLGIMKKTIKQEKQLAEILSEITKIQSNYTDAQIADILENVKQQLSCLV